jgi:hypothetical protein
MLRSGKALRRLRTAGFIAMVSGMFLGSLHAGRRQPREILIDEIRPCMSFSRVCVQGLVASGVRVLNDGTRFFVLADGTGSLPVLLNAASGSDKLQPGSRIAATGHLGVAVRNRRCLRVPDAGHIKRLEDAATVTVRGRVIEWTAPPPGSRAPYRLVLEHSGGRMEVVHWFKPRLDAATGDQIEAEGVLGIYRGRTQLKVHDAGGIRFQPDR